jgi:hypothetical protein
MKVGDLVKQRGSGVVMSEFIRSSLNLGILGIVKVVHEKTTHSYDGINRGKITVVWAHGHEEILPEIYLEVVENE